MKRSWIVWLTLAGCVAVALAAMSWISVTVVRLDAAAAKARRRAVLEENAHLALWRMDSALASLVAQESARPYLAYETFLPASVPPMRPGQPDADRRPLVPSPLLGALSPLLLAHFQLDSDGRLSSPQIPAEANYKLAVPRYLREDTVKGTKRALERILPTDRQRLATLLPKSEPAPVEVVYAPPAIADERLAEQRRADLQRRGRGAVEFENRNQAVLQNISGMAQSQVMNALPGLGPDATELSGVPMTALWLGDNLVLARRVVLNGRVCIQGCLLDWPAVKRWLLDSVADLLPAADLVPTNPSETGDESRRLAAIPARLLPGEVVWGNEPPASPVRLTLWLAWGSAIVALAAVGGLLWGVLRLSKRRAAFVSAVTHELRTPLTTFHMYTEMLVEGMVPDAQTQQTYLRTLHTEASRLSHLVENVLAYARLERGRSSGPAEQLPLAELLKPICRRLSERASQAGMELVVEGDARASTTLVRAKPSTLEQILFNLMDNACKYASQGADKRIHLSADLADSAVELRLRDHGPGLSRRPSRRLFRAFSKSAREAADSAPGIGLGLALSKRLARDMGARLGLDPQIADGACFVLRLPVSDG
jgi:signal transduction histidine kinase